MFFILRTIDSDDVMRQVHGPKRAFVISIVDNFKQVRSDNVDDRNRDIE